MRKYKSCAIRKARKKIIPHYSDLSNETKATRLCERIFLDFSFLKNPKNKGSEDKTPFILRSYMRLKHCEFLECCFINWFDTKDAMIEPTCKFFALYKNEGKPVHFLRMDGARESHLLVLAL